MEAITYVVLVWEHDEAAGDPARLEHVEHGKTFRDGQSVIQFVVNNLIRKAHGQRYTPRHEQNIAGRASLTSIGVAHWFVNRDGSHLS